MSFLIRGEFIKKSVVSIFERISIKHSLILIFFLSLTVVLAAQFLVPPEYRLDATDYHSYYKVVANNIIAGEGLKDNTGNPAVRYPPVHPIIIAGAFKVGSVLGISSDHSALMISAIGMGGISILLFLIVTKLWSPLFGWMVCLLWISYPLGLINATWPSSEVPFMLFLLISLLLWLNIQDKKRMVIVSSIGIGLILGLATLTRPIGWGVCIILAIFTIYRFEEYRFRRRIGIAALIMCSFLLVLIPWQSWVYLRMGSHIFISSAGVPAIRDGLTFAVDSKGFRRGVWVPDDVRELMKDIHSHYAEISTMSDMKEVVIEQVKIRPGAMLNLLIIKAVRSWYGTDSQRHEIIVFIIQLPYLILTLMALLSALRTGGRTRAFAGLVGLIVLYFWGMNILGTTLARYSIPSMNLLLIFVPAIFAAKKNQLVGEISEV